MQIIKSSLCLTLMLSCLIATSAKAEEKSDQDVEANGDTSSPENTDNSQVELPGDVQSPGEEDSLLVYSNPPTNQPDELATEEVEPIENTFNLLRAFTGLYYQNTYSTINNYLVDNVETDDVKSNMLEAIKWYHKELNKKSIFNRALVEALKQFTDLSKIGDTNKCNRNTYAILLKNDRATRGKAHKRPSKVGLFKRVEKIVYEYSVNHAVDCVHRYPLILNEQKAKMDQEKVHKTERLVDDIINSFIWSDKKLAKENKRLATYTLVKSLKSITNKRTSKIALDILDDYARDDPERRFLKKVLNEKKGSMELRKDKVKELVEKYLIEPCRYYVAQLGLNVFIPAHYDLIMLEQDDRYKETDEVAMDFLLGWSRYHVCNIIVDRDPNSLTRGIAKLAAKRD